mmetsp:Transcript_4246/g.15608  ORF Transcript_4246/g.15608 Transcript_4246/m.15608 type:complete len:88 (+) Transcript_4246:346-609(+)
MNVLILIFIIICATKQKSANKTKFVYHAFFFKKKIHEFIVKQFSCSNNMWPMIDESADATCGTRARSEQLHLKLGRRASKKLSSLHG